MRYGGFRPIGPQRGRLKESVQMPIVVLIAGRGAGRI